MRQESNFYQHEVTPHFDEGPHVVPLQQLLSADSNESNPTKMEECEVDLYELQVKNNDAHMISLINIFKKH